MASQYFWNPKFNGRNVSVLFFIFLTAHSDLRVRADLHELVAPHVYHLRLTPQHFAQFPLFPFLQTQTYILYLDLAYFHYLGTMTITAIAR
jgi:hypothetical protein